jgi:outer membrane protein W
MKSTMITIAAALLAAPLYAQEVTASRAEPPRAADDALEITLGAGYAQGFGDIGGGQRNLTDQSSAGGELQLGVGYRINPNFMVGAYGSGSLHATGDFTPGANIYTATAGVQANYHFLPSNEWDPWVGLGSGWRALWINHANSGGTDSRHGLDIARITAGVDYRVNSQFAVSPYVGMGITTFLTQELANEQGFSNVHNPDANVWVFGGIQGRFDLFGNTGPTMKLASAN